MAKRKNGQFWITGIANVYREGDEDVYITGSLTDPKFVVGLLHAGFSLVNDSKVALIKRGEFNVFIDHSGNVLSFDKAAMEELKEQGLVKEEK